MSIPSRWVFAVIVAVGAISFLYSALAQERTQTHPAMPADSAKAGSPRDALAKLVGDYSRVVKFVGQDNATPSTGTSKFTPILNGKFIREESSDMVFGNPVEGLRIYGYDDSAKQYQMARMYTMSTAITIMRGTSSDGGKTIDFTGETATGTGKTTMHALLKWTSGDQFSVTLSTVDTNGKETPFQKTEYTRKK